MAVAGIPKTIDNDIDHIDHSFGFASAVEAAQVAIRSAKTEAVCNLVSLVVAIIFCASSVRLYIFLVMQAEPGPHHLYLRSLQIRYTMLIAQR